MNDLKYDHLLIEQVVMLRLAGYNLRQIRWIDNYLLRNESIEAFLERNKIPDNQKWKVVEYVPESKYI